MRNKEKRRNALISTQVSVVVDAFAASPTAKRLGLGDASMLRLSRGDGRSLNRDANVGETLKDGDVLRVSASVEIKAFRRIYLLLIVKSASR